MQNENVNFNFDLLCDWRKAPPIYRVYVNHEMFAERTYVWDVNHYINENLSIVAPPGKYTVRVENLGDPDCVFKIRNLNVEKGPARVIDSKTIEVYNENQ